jgi:hypothetical protein
VLADAFNLLNVTYEKKANYIKMKKDEMEQRMRTGKTVKMTAEAKDKIRQEKLKERYEFEEGRMGQYELIYPSQNEE